MKCNNKKEYYIYEFNEINLKIKNVYNQDEALVYINYKEYNPLLVMLLGNFESECQMDSINFTTKKENESSNTMYSIIKSSDEKKFIKEIYYFILENNIDDKLNIRDKNIWTF